MTSVDPPPRKTRVGPESAGSTQEQLPVGSVLLGRYRIDQIIGQGGMGMVYRGVHVNVGRSVAIKVLSREWSENPDVTSRFLAEARAASTAGHPNIIQVFDVDQLPDSRLFLVMEFLPGINLYEEIQQSGPLDPPRACRIALDVARAIRAAHECNVVHRDLKPENVMLAPSREGELVKVLDFGVAAVIDDESQRRTRPGLTIGTPETMAPEQAKGANPTPLFDIYALGCVLFEALVGEPPFLAETPLAIITRKIGHDAPTLASRRPELPEALCRLVDDCLARDPSLRPQDADEVCRRLEEILVAFDRPAAVAAAPRAQADGDPAPKSRRLVYAALGISAVVLLGTTAWLAIAAAPDTQDQHAQSMAAPHDAVAAMDPQPEPGPKRAEPAAPPVPEPASSATAETPAEPEPPPPEKRVRSDAQEPPEERVRTDGQTQPEPPQQRSGRPEAPGRASSRRRRQKPSPTRSAQASDSPECRRVRQATFEARQAHDWGNMLRYVDRGECWPSSAQRRKLRVQALMELDRFAQCARLGAGLSDPEVKRWVTICTRRAQSG